MPVDDDGRDLLVHEDEDGGEQRGDHGGYGAPPGVRLQLLHAGLWFIAERVDEPLPPFPRRRDGVGYLWRARGQSDNIPSINDHHPLRNLSDLGHHHLHLWRVDASEVVHNDHADDGDDDGKVRDEGPHLGGEEAGRFEALEVPKAISSSSKYGS